MTAVPGEPIGPARLPNAASVAYAAGRDLALLNQVPVEGFGFIRRTDAAPPFVGEFAAYGQFVTSSIPLDWPSKLAQLFSPDALHVFERVLDAERERPLARAQLAHGDFDVTQIVHDGGRFSGLIDFGEVRGAEPTFDLGHFLLHDRETYPEALFEAVLAGYREVVPISGDGEIQMCRSGLLLGLRQLCRWLFQRHLPADAPLVQTRVGQLTRLLRSVEP
jgi:aminoglycoside phosphotransferase (APT) family kinase protein